jgi:hypothetical protein
LPPRLAAFLRLTPDARWSEDAVRCFDLKPGPEHDPRLLDWYSDRVARTFGSDPELAAKLQRVVDYRRAASASTQAR